MATQHQLYVVGTSPVEISESWHGSGRDITIQNANASGYIYVGGTGVSSTNYGYRILPNHAISFELVSHDEIFVVASASNMNVAVIKLNLETEGNV